MKQHAKEYLIEFAEDQPKWLKALVYDSIELNGEISDDRLDEIYKNLSEGSAVVIQDPVLEEQEPRNAVTIETLSHHAGVNALASGQTIKFSENVTMLYGLNGAGKSSYFKVINEIVGGNQRKTILPNIYSETQKEISVELVYKEMGGNKTTVNWDGTERAIYPLNNCKVFDSSYLRALLETRKSDATLVHPLGLHLFAQLVSIVDGFKEKLTKEADSIRLSKPNINCEYFSDQLKTVFEKHTISTQSKQSLREKYIFLAESQQQLKVLKEDLRSLEQNNIADKIRLETLKKKGLNSIRKSLQSVYNSLSKNKEELRDLISNYIKQEGENKKAKEQFSVLNSIPLSDTAEWKEFVKSGVAYSEKVGSLEDVCGYCQQSLQTRESVEIIKAYSKFLKDSSEQKLSNTLEKFDELKNEIEKLALPIAVPESVEEHLDEHVIKGSKKSLHREIQAMSKEFEEAKELLTQEIANKKKGNEIKLSTISPVVKILDKLIQSSQEHIEILEAEGATKEGQIEEIKTKLSELLENESISVQQDSIKTWIEANTLEVNLRGKAAKINSRKITECSKTAHSALLTDSLKRYFTEELNKIGYPNLDANIEGGGSAKGTSSTRLVLTKSKDIKAILSEGEQKAVALALFVAETRMQKTKNPIVLDDPVTSLDHKIAGKFANRLLVLDNQIIIFNHNKLFLDGFETSKENHICKDFNSCSKSKGKHVRIYSVLSEGKSSKGILSNYKQNKAKNHINEAKKHLSKTPFEEGIKVAGLIRKSVECCIDEIVFNHQTPTKYSNKNSRISWAELKELKNDGSIIDILEQIHGRASGGELHNGSENDENPIEKEEFNQMISSLESILTP